MILINISGKEKEIRFDFNAICALEEKTNKSIMALMSDKEVGFNSIRLLLWAGLRHSNKNLTLEAVGNFINDFIKEKNSLDTLMNKILNALKESGIMGETNGESLGE